MNSTIFKSKHDPRQKSICDIVSYLSTVNSSQIGQRVLVKNARKCVKVQNKINISSRWWTVDWLDNNCCLPLTHTLCIDNTQLWICLFYIYSELSNFYYTNVYFIVYSCGIDPETFWLRSYYWTSAVDNNALLTLSCHIEEFWGIYS